MAQLETLSEIEDIIANCRVVPVFQGVFNVNTSSLLGYDVFIRGPDESPLHNPHYLFLAARQQQLVRALERCCHRVSIEQFLAYSAAGYLFLKTDLSRGLDVPFKIQDDVATLRSQGLPCQRLIIELALHDLDGDWCLLAEVAGYYREQGIAIAIVIEAIAEHELAYLHLIRPDYVKVSRYGIHAIEQSLVKRQALSLLVKSALKYNFTIIACGVEVEDELECISTIGVDYAQGYFFSRPAKTILTSLPVNMPERAPVNREARTAVMKASALAVNTLTLSPEQTMQEVFEFIRNNPLIDAVAIVEKNHPVGLIERQTVLELFSSPFGRELSAKKKLSHFMERNNVVVEQGVSLEEVSRLLTDNSQRLKQHFIITDEQQFMGVGLTSDLLKNITEQQIRNARHANPLTQLPGNVPIQEAINERLTVARPFHVGYIDLNNFKPFNDYYGYSIGDQAIILLANIIKKVVDSNLDFIGHIGGDDFVVILTGQYYKQQCQLIVEMFSQQVVALYREEDRLIGGIASVNRKGEKQFFELLSLVVGVVSPDLDYSQNYHDIAWLAADAKHQAKLLGGNQVFFSRRRKADNSNLKNQVNC